MTDCEKCMEDRTKTERQQFLGCGYEYSIDGATGWDHPDRKKGEKDPPISTCIGYTSKLPEVIETVRAHRHWREGAGLTSVRQFFGGLPLSDEQIAGIEILDNAVNEKENWRSTPKDKGGGME